MTDTDPRVRCTECRHYRPLRCVNPAGADLRSGEVSRAFAALRQWCPGWVAKLVRVR